MTKIMGGYAKPLKSPVGSNRLNLKYFNLGLFAVIAGLGFVYMINISDLTVQGFALRDLKAQATNLASTEAENEETVNSAQSYYSLSSRTQGLNMVAVGDVEYITAPNSTVAKR